MPEHAEILFENMLPMMKKLKKASYETNMDEFMGKHRSFFKEMLDYIDESGNKDEAALELANSFVTQIKDAFSVNGKIKSRKQVDMNFFMIYYVFPAILLIKSPHSKLLADNIRDLWRVTFKESKNLDYTDYDKLHNSFREKIFGIF